MSYCFGCLRGEHAYRRANQYLQAQGDPEPGALGPPESPSLLGAATDLLASAGTAIADLAAVSRLPADRSADVVAAGSKTKPKLRVPVN